jgi:hypothetical protein
MSLDTDLANQWCAHFRADGYRQTGEINLSKNKGLSMSPGSLVKDAGDRVSFFEPEAPGSKSA